MNRRSFLGTTAAALAASRVSQAAPASPRRVLPLNRNWLFGGKAVAGGASPTFDDSRFQRVTLPHTNVVLPWHSFDDKAYEFVSLYRRHFKLPAELKGQRIFIDFEGVMTAATVTINGHRLLEYKGGYTPFSHEITAQVNWSADNVIAVEVDSSERRLQMSLRFHF